MLTKILQDSKKRALLFDLCLIFALLLLSGVILLFSHLFAKAGTYAVVTVNGKETARYSLSADGEYPLNGGTNLLVIQGGKAYLKDADCPDKLCVKQGSICRVGEKIICLPNRLTVEIVGEKSDNDPDFLIWRKGGSPI